MFGQQKTAVVLSPHPDDEVLGCPGLVLGLVNQGWRVVNVLCLPGREQHSRAERADSSVDACEVLGVTSREIGVADSYNGDVQSLDWSGWSAELMSLIEEYTPRLVIMPSSTDRHPAHVAVAKAGKVALEAGSFEGLFVVQWSMWGYVETANLAVGFDARELSRALEALSYYGQEIVRLRLDEMLNLRARLGALTATEIVFGFGETLPTESRSNYADVVCVECYENGAWNKLEPRFVSGQSIGELFHRS